LWALRPTQLFYAAVGIAVANRVRVTLRVRVRVRVRFREYPEKWSKKKDHFSNHFS
jgi:hypothetical protein